MAGHPFVVRWYVPMVILNVDVTDKEFVVTKAPLPKTDNEGNQRTSKDQLPLWSTQLVVTDPDGGSIINVSTEGDRPDVEVRDEVDVHGLIAFPWFSNGKSGVAYRAESITLITD